MILILLVCVALTDASDAGIGGVQNPDPGVQNPDPEHTTVSVLFSSTNPFPFTNNDQEAKQKFLQDCSKFFVQDNRIACTNVEFKNLDVEIEMTGTPIAFVTNYVFWKTAHTFAGDTFTLEECDSGDVGSEFDCAVAGHCEVVAGDCKQKCIFMNNDECAQNQQCAWNNGQCVTQKCEAFVEQNECESIGSEHCSFNNTECKRKCETIDTHICEIYTYCMVIEDVCRKKCPEFKSDECADYCTATDSGCMQAKEGHTIIDLIGVAKRTFTEAEWQAMILYVSEENSDGVDPENINVLVVDTPMGVTLTVSVKPGVITIPADLDLKIQGYILREYTIQTYIRGIKPDPTSSSNNFPVIIVFSIVFCTFILFDLF